MRKFIALCTLMAAFVAPIGGAEPEPLPKVLVDAWNKQNHRLGWIGTMRDQGTVGHQFAKDLLEPNSLVPAFQLSRKSRPDLLARLPHPARPFGIELYLEKTGRPLLEELKAFKHLTRLVMYECPISEEDLLTLAEIPQLEELQLNSCKITDNGLNSLARLKNLKKLGLRGTKITDAGIPNLKAFEKLEHLEIGANLQITDKAAPALAELKSLKFLDIYLTKFTDEGLKSIATMGHLRSLDLRNTRTTAIGLKRLGALKDLERFAMDGYGVNPESIAAVLGMKRLTHLSLNIPHPDKTAAGDVEFKGLGTLKGIQELSVFGWQITDASLPTIRSFEKLEFIELRYTRIKQESAMQLQKDRPNCRVFIP